MELGTSVKNEKNVEARFNMVFEVSQRKALSISIGYPSAGFLFICFLHRFHRRPNILLCPRVPLATAVWWWHLVRVKTPTC